jgi:hypothetical protein
MIKNIYIYHLWLASIAHTYNPSYSGHRSRGSGFKASPGKQFLRPYLEKAFTKIGLVEGLKMKAPSSSPSTTKNKTKKNPTFTLF